MNKKGKGLWMIDDKVHWIDVLPLCLHSFFATFNNFEKWSSHPLNIGANFLKLDKHLMKCQHINVQMAKFFHKNFNL